MHMLPDFISQFFLYINILDGIIYSFIAFWFSKVLHFAVRLRKPCYLATQAATFRPQTAMWRHLVVRAGPQVRIISIRLTSLKTMFFLSKIWGHDDGDDDDNNTFKQYGIDQAVILLRRKKLETICGVRASL